MSSWRRLLDVMGIGQRWENLLELDAAGFQGELLNLGAALKSVQKNKFGKLCVVDGVDVMALSPAVLDAIILEANNHISFSEESEV